MKDIDIPSVKEFDQTPEWSDDLSPDELRSEIDPFFSTPESQEVPVSEDSLERNNEYIDEREYGLKECSEAAKDIFSREILLEWKNMSYKERKEIAERYAKAISAGLGIEPGRVYFIPWPENQRGRNVGDGNIYLNADFLGNPKNVIDLIDTIAHEIRHQFQMEAVATPERFGFSPEVAQEWRYGLKYYTTDYATQYDPWGYHYNPVEIDARYFGETIVREVTKDLIQELRYGETLSSPKH